MTIGFILADNYINDVNFNEVYCGNPGCGGAEYQMALLFSELTKNNNNEITVFHYNKSVVLPDSVNEVIINDFSDLLCYEHMILVVNLTNELEGSNLNQLISKSSHDFIIWVHCRLNKNNILMLASEKNVKKIVFVTPNEMELIGNGIPLNKRISILNMIPCFKQAYSNIKENHWVVYVGNISRYKGFTYFLKQWKRIKDSVKDAELFVVGDGSLYNRNNKFSEYNLCKPDYEKEIYEILKKDEIFDSVHFLGLMGIEKKEIIKKAALGIITNQNVETFCITALEYQQCRTPVLALNKDGLKTTVKNGVTGFLCENFSEMGQKAIEILQNKYTFNFESGFVESFTINKRMKEWNELFSEIENNSK